MADGNNENKPNRPGPGAAPQIDYRFALANDRTYLVWERTALGLLVAAVAVAFVPQLAIPGPRHLLGAVLAVLGTLTAAMGLLRWEQIDHAVRRGKRLPHHPGPGYLALVVIVIAVLTTAFVIIEALAG